MKIALICPICIGDKNVSEAANRHYMSVEDSGIYKLICSQGHTVNILVQDLRHELLFEAGAIALIDGYPREAVANFASSLDTFSEFMGRVLARAAGIDLSTVKPHFGKSREAKIIVSTLLFAMLNGKPPPLRNEPPGLRTDVIHEGKFPTVEEATSFGESALKYMVEVLSGLNEKCRQALKQETLEHVRSIARVAEDSATCHRSYVDAP